MSLGSSIRCLNRLSACSSSQTLNSIRLKQNGQSTLLVVTPSVQLAFFTSSCSNLDGREGTIDSSSENLSSSAPSIEFEEHEHDSHEIDVPTSGSTIHLSVPSPSSPPPSLRPPSSPLLPSSSGSLPSSQLPKPEFAPAPSYSAPPSFSPSSSRPPRSSLLPSNLTSSFGQVSPYPSPQSEASYNRLSKTSPTPSAPPPSRTLPGSSSNTFTSPVHLQKPSIPKSIGQQLHDLKNDPVALKRLGNWLMQDRHREKDFNDWGLICQLCPPDLAIRMLTSPHAYGLKPLQNSHMVSSQVYRLRSVISKLVLSHPRSTASSGLTIVSETISYNMMHDPDKLVPLLNQFLKLSEVYLPGDPYILLLALRAYASFPGVGDLGRTKVIELIHANKASWWPEPSLQSVGNDNQEFTAARSPSLDSRNWFTLSRSQRFKDIDRHRLTDLDAWTILKQVDRLRLIPDLSLEICSSWDRQPVPAPLRKQRLRLLRPLQQLERLSDAPSLSDRTPHSDSSEQETTHRVAIVPYEQIARFVTPALYQAPTDPIVLLFSMYLLHLTSFPGDVPLRTLSAQALSTNGVEREVRGGFDSMKEMSETYRMMKKALGVLKNVWGNDGEAVWEVIREDLRSQVVEAEKLRNDRAKGKTGSLKRMS